jgi:hypothetical protein
MFFLASLTGLAGLTSSFVLLHGGVDTMLMRYPLAVGCAYLVFLFLLWLWLRTKADDYVDGPTDFPQFGSSGEARRPGLTTSWCFAGGMAVAVLRKLPDGRIALPSLPQVDIPAAIGRRDGGEVTAALTRRDLCWRLPLVAALAARCCLWVYLAPFAELLVDGVCRPPLPAHARLADAALAGKRRAPYGAAVCSDGAWPWRHRFRLSGLCAGRAYAWRSSQANTQFG